MNPQLIPIANLSCKESFKIYHHLNSLELSNTANKQAYGTCNNPNTHFHDYTLEVTTRGTVNYNIGTVMSLSNLRKYIANAVIDKLNGKNLNVDVEVFRSVPSTIENLAVYIWRCIKLEMESPELLYEVKLTDNEENCVIYNGGAEFANYNGNNFLTSDTD